MSSLGTVFEGKRLCNNNMFSKAVWVKNPEKGGAWLRSLDYNTCGNCRGVDYKRTLGKNIFDLVSGEKYHQILQLVLGIEGGSNAP